MANTTGTLTDAVLKMRRELPRWALKLEVDSAGYVVALIPPVENDAATTKHTATDDHWSFAAHRLVDEQIERERG